MHLGYLTGHGAVAGPAKLSAGPSTSFLRKYLRVVRAAANLMMTTKTLGRRMPWSEHSIAAKIAIAPLASYYPLPQERRRW